MFQLQFHDHTVYVDHLAVGRTYRGLLVGIPDEEMNQRIVERAVADTKKQWPHEPVVAVPPKITMKPRRYPRPGQCPDYPSLPTLAWDLTLTSTVKVGTDAADGSCLRLIVFTELNDGHPRDVLQPVLTEANLVWADLAADFEF